MVIGDKGEARWRAYLPTEEMKDLLLKRVPSVNLYASVVWKIHI